MERDAKDLSKEDKGRLKKLRKRANRVIVTSRVSGIVSTEDRDELQSLDPTTLLSPDFHWRPQKTEGSEHRSIIQYFLQKTSRKRKRSPESSSMPSWVTLHNPVALDRLGVVEVHCEDAEKMSTILQSLSGCKVSCCPTRWFNGSKPMSLTEVLMYSCTKRSQNEDNRLPIASFQDLVAEVRKLIPPRSVLQQEDYPLVDDVTTVLQAPSDSSHSDLETAISNVKSYGIVIKGENYVRSILDQQQSVFAIDCEMVITCKGLELARVTVVKLTDLPSSPDDLSSSMETIMDEIVVPHSPVQDYVTHFSGITKEILDKATTRIEQVQIKLLSIIGKDDIVIGHSLENDLHSLRFVHDMVVDTAILFQAPGANFKYKLKTLADRLLKKTIQSPLSPHCSQEDAAAALHLVVRRAMQGSSFRMPAKTYNNILHSSCDSKDIFVGAVGSGRWLDRHLHESSFHSLACDSPDHVNSKALVSWMGAKKPGNRVVWSSWSVPTSRGQSLVETIQQTVEKMPMTSILVIPIQSSYEAAEAFYRQRQASKKSSADEEEQCVSAVDFCRDGVCMWVVKQPEL